VGFIVARTNGRFKSMLNMVHIDEKLFHMTEESGTFYLLPDELPPERSCESKRFIPKIMFITAIARPRIIGSTGEKWLGKIGIFPLVTEESTKRTSKNRPKGTIEIKPIASVKKEVVKDILINKIFPAIRSSWPKDPNQEVTHILIQLNNAKPHPRPDDEELIQEGKKDGFDIRLIYQPPNSPDTNVLDLGFFQSIQSLQHQKAPANVPELIAAVIDSFEQLDADTIDKYLFESSSMLVGSFEVFMRKQLRYSSFGKIKTEVKRNFAPRSRMPRRFDQKLP
jgi:hypothetical protein